MIEFEEVTGAPFYIWKEHIVGVAAGREGSGTSLLLLTTTRSVHVKGEPAGIVRFLELARLGRSCTLRYEDPRSKP